MGIISRFRKLTKNIDFLSKRNLTDVDWFKDNFPSWFDTTSGVSKRQSLKISTVYTCLNILGETFGSLPFDVKEDTSEGRVTRKDHPVYKLIHSRPNPYTNAFDFWSTIQKIRKGWGNAYALIERDGATPIALWLIHPSEMRVMQRGRDIVYVYKDVAYPHTDILHFKNSFSLDGIIGLSAIDENRITIGHAKKLKEYNSSLVGTRPYGYLSADVPPRDTAQKDNLKKLWSKVDTVGDLPLLYGGIKFNPLTLPADAVAYIESADLTEQEIYGIFRIPPTLAQNYKRATFSNAEQQDLVFSKYSLADRIGIEQEVNAKLLPDNLYSKFNLKGILAGDIKTRVEFYRMALTLGLLSQNDVLNLEDMEGFEGGDRHYIQGAMVPLDKIDQFISKNNKVEKLNGVINEN